MCAPFLLLVLFLHKLRTLYYWAGHRNTFCLNPHQTKGPVKHGRRGPLDLNRHQFTD